MTRHFGWISIVLLLSCSNCYITYHNGEAKLGPGTHVGLCTSAATTLTGGVLRVIAAFGELQSVEALRAAEFLVLGGVLTGLLTVYMTLANAEVPETEKKQVKMVPLDEIIEHLKPGKEERVPRTEETSSRKKQSHKAEKQKPAEDPEPRSDYLACPAGTNLRGKSPPDGYEQYCVGRDGKTKEGPFLSWYEEGKKASEGSYKDGKLHGKWMYWYGNGKVRLQAEFDHGEKSGTWIWYDRKGNQKKTQTHR